MTRWHQKADALATAWERRFGAPPPKHSVVLALSVAQFETRCGDAWPGPDGIIGTQDDENNWGATTLRSLNAAERAAVSNAGVVPSVGTGHEQRAQAAQRAIVAAGLPVASGTLGGIAVPRATIHCDSRTEQQNGKNVLVPYFVWFASFERPDQGAEYFLHLLAGGGRPAKSVLDNPKGTVDQLAAAMYRARYFWGFKPHGTYTDAKGVVHDGNAENIAAYAKNLRAIRAGIEPALADWEPKPGAPPTAAEPLPLDLSTARGVQEALNRLGCGRPPLKLDGDFGTRSIAALGFYQGGSVASDGETPLPVTGQRDAETLRAMRRDLTDIGVPT